MLLIKLSIQVTLLVMTVTNDYRKILLIMLFITSWCKPLKPDSSNEIGPYATWFKPSLLPNKHPDKRTYICYYSTLKLLTYYGMSLENVTVFNQLFGCPKAKFGFEWCVN